jgi:DNA-binding CsgD family transcriptional regulator
VVVNVTELVEPYVTKLKQGRLDGKQTASVGIIESNLHDIISPLARTLSSKLYSLTPREIRVAGSVKGEKTTKEIAELMNISIKTVAYHRDNIRKNSA